MINASGRIENWKIICFQTFFNVRYYFINKNYLTILIFTNYDLKEEKPTKVHKALEFSFHDSTFEV